MPSYRLTSIDHVQLAMPAGQEQKARAFYGDLLGMAELPKPVALAARGGAWFTTGDVQIHLGVEQEFRPARKAHPALRVSGYELLLNSLREHDINVTEDDSIPGVRRAHIFDPFGNRIELIAD